MAEIDRASDIRDDVQQLIRTQIETLSLASSLTASQLFEYHSRVQAIQTLYEELDQINSDRIALSM